MRRVLLIPSFALVATAAACGCKATLSWRLEPHEQSLKTGESFTASMQFFSGCVTAKTVRDEISWRSTDSNVVHVDSLTGRATALRPGVADVVPTGKRYGAVDRVRVTVNAR